MLLLRPKVILPAADLVFMTSAVEGAAHGQSLGFLDVVQSCLVAKRAANLRADYLRELERCLRRFSDFIGPVNIASISHWQIEQWLARPGLSPASRATGMNRLSALFSFAVRRGLIDRNPVDRLDRVRLERRPPMILSPNDTARLLAVARASMPEFLPYLIVGVFAGVRPKELERLRFEDINFRSGVIRVDAAASKVRRRRIVELEANAQLWLAEFSGRSGPVVDCQVRRKLRRLRVAMGWDSWPKDILRHTCASYLMAKHRDAALVADWLGNSPAILLTHYRELVSREDCLAFWELLP